MKKRKLAVLVSGTGRNLQAVLDAIDAGGIPGRVVRVISNRPDVRALDIAADAGIDAQLLDHTDFPDRVAFDAALARCIDESGADAVILAGFMRILTPEFVQRYTGRMLNIHPSLLPLYRGLHTHRRALQDAQAEHGASIHFVTPELDGGPVIKQGRIQIKPDDTEHSLAERVFSEVERWLYPEVIGWLCSGKLELRRGQVRVDGETRSTPLVSDYPPVAAVD